MLRGGGSPKRKGGRPKKVKPEESEDDAVGEEPAKRSKLSEIQKGQLEAEIIAELPVSEIAERFEVSTAYVYIVKGRLRKEGRI